MDNRSEWVFDQLLVGIIVFIIVGLSSFFIEVGGAVYDTIIELINGEEETPTDTNEDKPKLYEYKVYICLDENTTEVFSIRKTETI